MSRALSFNTVGVELLLVAHDVPRRTCRPMHKHLLFILVIWLMRQRRNGIVVAQQTSMREVSGLSRRCNKYDAVFSRLLYSSLLRRCYHLPSIKPTLKAFVSYYVTFVQREEHYGICILWIIIAFVCRIRFYLCMRL